MQTEPSAPISLTFLKLMVLAALAYLLVVVALEPPIGSRASDAPVSEVSGIVQLNPAAPPGVAVTPAATEPRAARVLDVRLGPGDGYAIVGLVPRGGQVEVVGRDQSGEWLAISFNPGSKLQGWVPSAAIAGLGDVAALRVVPLSPNGLR
jgi:hypothetical protein